MLEILINMIITFGGALGVVGLIYVIVEIFKMVKEWWSE